MQISKVTHPYVHMLFKALVILFALALMPVIWAYMSHGSIIPTSFVTAWPRMIGQFFALSPLIATVLFPIALSSIILWWRRPQWTTALFMYFMLPVVCGAPGGTLLGFMFWAR